MAEIDGFLQQSRALLTACPQAWNRRGQVVQIRGLQVLAAGLKAHVGEVCAIEDAQGRLQQEAEVVAQRDGLTALSLLGAPAGLAIGMSVRVLPDSGGLLMGEGLLGRVLDGRGRPMDGLGPWDGAAWRPIRCDPPDPLKRRRMTEPVFTGVRAIDGLITFAEGQRIGVMAPAGVGKSTLMGMLARSTAFDVTVIGLIGERGREVREFMEESLGEAGRARAVVVCATSDKASMERANAALLATSVAEHFRDCGKRVLLMMDSFTRYARALREIGLANGEAPARRGYPASVFAELPRILERAGMGEAGSITAIYTLLAEDDTGSDPITEEVRGIVDGHIVLSRKIAARGQYPAIDVLASLSRVMSQVVPEWHQQANRQIRQRMSRFEELEMLLQMGEYKSGQDGESDAAIRCAPAIGAFLRQDTQHLEPPEGTMALLQGLLT